LEKFNIYKALLSVSVISLLLAIQLVVAGNVPDSGPLFIIFFISLAFAVRGFKAFRGFSYTIFIFTAVTASMFYPQFFSSVGDFQLKTLIVPLLQVIMFGMGSQMSLDDFTGVIRMPKGVLIGVGAQFTIMPLVGFTIANIFDFPPEIKAGIILIGCVPSGLASNVMSYIAHANLPLAVTIAAITTLISPFITPSLMKVLGGQFIEVSFWSMMFDILNMIILPIIAGFTFNLIFKSKTGSKARAIQLGVFLIIILLTSLVKVISKGLDMDSVIYEFIKQASIFVLLPAFAARLLKIFAKDDPVWMSKILSFVSMAGIALIITIITASGRESLLKVGALLIVTSLIHNVAGYTLGYSVAWLTGMPEKDRRTIAFEVGMQNGGLASGLALQMGKIATVGLAPAIFGPLMNVTGSALASWWRTKPPVEKTEQKTEI
jgi:BASS family bile acid:Na+ symporter